MLGKDFFTPQSVAVVGASNNPDKIGYALVKNILESGYRGEVYPVNPGESEVLSLVCYPGVTDLPRRVDMALIAVSWQAVFPVLDDCAARGIKRLVMISAGFKEAGEHGSRLEKELLKALRKHGMRLLGPNCLGFINTSLPINATFASGVFPSGDMSLVAQSGAMRQSYWDWSRESGLGLNRRRTSPKATSWRCSKTMTRPGLSLPTWKVSLTASASGGWLVRLPRLSRSSC